MNACGSLRSWGVAWIVPTLARASVTPSSTCVSCAANPFTVFTRFGIRSARRWYWFTTSAQAALICSSLRWSVL
ncbi:hypothetical protein D3C83_68330 [compost metagenome]